MRARSVVLAARVKGAGPKSRPGGVEHFEPVQFNRGRPLPPKGELIGYYIRFWEGDEKKIKAAGKDLHTAVEVYRNIELNHARLEKGLAPIEGPAGLLHDFKSHAPERKKIADAVASWIKNLELRSKSGELSEATLVGYQNAVEGFRDTCGVTYMDEITGDVLKAHKLYLYENLPKRSRGKQLNTVAKRFSRLSTFFTSQGIKMSKDRNNPPGDRGLMAWTDVPKEQLKQNIDKYSSEEIKGMLEVADVDQADLIHTFLRTGFRDEEVAYLRWSDIDWKNRQITSDEKPEYNWRPKDKEKRTIPLEDGVLLKRLQARQNRQSPKSDLVFPNTLGNADTHLIRQLRKVVAKMKERGLAIEGVPTLHRFRRTYASRMIPHSDLQTVKRLLGHSNIKTTERYLAPDDKLAREASKTAFAEAD